MAALLEEFAPSQPGEVPEPQEPAQPEPPADDPRPAGEPPHASGDNAPAMAAEPSPLEPAPAVYGDSAYGGGASLALLEQMGATPMVKVQGPHARHGCFTKDRFVIDPAGT